MTDTPQVLLAHHLKTLKLPTFLREYDKLARQCATEGADHVRYLVRLTELELIDRERRMVERRIRQARFPAVKSLDSFDFKAIASLNKMLVLELARCEYVERRENIIALGNSGTGKTHIALGLAACQKGLSVGFLTAAAEHEASRWLVKRFVLPDLGKMAIDAVDREHIAALHHKHRDTPYQANRILEVVRKMFNLAEAWGLRKDGGNPCRFAQKYKEKKRERFLTEEEFHRLGQVLNEIVAEGAETLSAVTAIRLLMLTGCRLSEIQTLRWEDVNLETTEIRLRDGKTGARMVPLSGAAASVLSALPRLADNPWVIVGKKPGAHLTDLQHPWRRIRARAELDDVRIHDLRRSFASRALALGESLPMIGKLLGHTQVQTTARYAHLANESVKASGSRVGDSIGLHIAPDQPA